MRLLKNDRGVVLVTTLLLTLIAFGIAMVMLYLVLQGTKLSGTSRQYKNTLEAGMGGVEIITKEALPALLDATTATGFDPNNASAFTGPLGIAIPGLVLDPLNPMNNAAKNKCLLAKLTTRSTSWGGVCTPDSLTLDARTSPDVTFTLTSAIPGGAAGYRVYTKIVSTTPGSTDLSGRYLWNRATTGGPEGDVGAPYLYRVEVVSEKAFNPKQDREREKATLSVLYAY